MDTQTIQRLNAINRTFYQVTAHEFDATRQQPWPGWEPVVPLLKTPLSVLDVGCGNGRFGLFLAERALLPLDYTGIDSSPDLLAHAHSALKDRPGLKIALQERDIVENPPDTGLFDLVILFGVLHHIPGFANRQQFMHTLSERVAPGGLLVFACWRFYEYERFRERLVPWPADIQVEKHDYLLDWRRGQTALRYCHYVDDTEHQALTRATGLTETLTYRADGFTGDVNNYSILQNI